MIAKRDERHGKAIIASTAKQSPPVGPQVPGKREVEEGQGETSRGALLVE